MMMARASLLGVLAARPDAPLGEVYGRLNECLRRTLERTGLRLYMTLALVEAVGGGRFRAVGAHLPVLVRRAPGAGRGGRAPGRGAGRRRGREGGWAWSTPSRPTRWGRRRLRSAPAMRCSSTPTASSSG